MRGSGAPGGRNGPQPGPPGRVRAAGTGLAGGVVSGLTGLGGGTVLVPVLTTLLRMPQRRAHATSLAIVIFVASAAAVLYVARGEVRWSLVVALSIGGALGAQAGTAALYRLPERALRLGFGLFLTAVGLRLLLFG